jgi:hypothetical protein
MKQFCQCPRCGERGLERLSTHAFCVNCNYDEVHSDELCVVPQWALDVLKTVKPKSVVRALLPREKEFALENAV